MFDELFFLTLCRLASFFYSFIHDVLDENEPINVWQAVTYISHENEKTYIHSFKVNNDVVCVCLLFVFFFFDEKPSIRKRQQIFVLLVFPEVAIGLIVH